MRKNNLRVPELIDKTYNLLVERHAPRELTFENLTRSLIADDSDHHRTRKGYMIYENVGLFDLEGKTWGISVGEKGGSYPGAEYVNDMVGLSLNPESKNNLEILEELRTSIRESAYFRNSFFIGLNNGDLAFVNTVFGFPARFGPKIKEIVEPKLFEFVAQSPEYNKNFISAYTLSHPVTRQMLYKPETVTFLADSVERVLRESK